MRCRGLGVSRMRRPPRMLDRESKGGVRGHRHGKPARGDYCIRHASSILNYIIYMNMYVYMYIKNTYMVYMYQRNQGHQLPTSMWSITTEPSIGPQTLPRINTTRRSTHPRIPPWSTLAAEQRPSSSHRAVSWAPWRGEVELRERGEPVICSLSSMMS